tara:strand:- start:651 stop:1079 length:429 start_codon:yes stop_codon:yes gene_type:complete
MNNLFFNLPEEIQNYIYSIRLNNPLNKLYNIRKAQKKAMKEIVMKLRPSYNLEMNIMYDPFNSQTAYISKKCLNILTNKDDINWWIINLIRPIEKGLIFGYPYHYCPYSHNYVNTEYFCDKLIEKFGCIRIPNRLHSLSYLY